MARDDAPTREQIATLLRERLLWSAHNVHEANARLGNAVHKRPFDTCMARCCVDNREALNEFERFESSKDTSEQDDLRLRIVMLENAMRSAAFSAEAIQRNLDRAVARRLDLDAEPEHICAECCTRPSSYVCPNAPR